MKAFDFGKLRWLRRKQHLKQADVAKMMHCTSASISKAELGITRVDANDLARLADIYGVRDMNTFFVERIKREEIENDRH